MPTFHGKIASGKLFITDRPAFDAWQKRAKQGEVLLKIKNINEKNRSSKQQRYYFGVLIKTLADETGYTTDEMHEALKYKFLQEEGIYELPKIKSTSDLTTVEQEELNTKIREWASSELNIYLPEPNETVRV